MAQLLARLNYDFTDVDLARAALTHRSVGSSHNERLEFLGDAILDLVIAEALFQARPSANEGDLSRLRASLVKGEALAKIARELELGDFLILGTGELRSGGFRRKSILADALEALIAAVYLDGGFDAARRVINHLYADHMQNLPESSALRDPKTRLQEWLQARGAERPVYRVAEVSGLGHEQQFRVICEVAALDLSASGNGTSRRRAEQTAAQAILEQVDDE